MNLFSKLALAALVVAAPAQAHASEWWLVAGEPGDNVAQFADSASITGNGDVRTITVADNWRDGRSVVRTVSVDCRKNSAVALDRFACGDDRYRMRTAMLVGEMERENFARVLFSVPKAGTAQVKVAAN